MRQTLRPAFLFVFTVLTLACTSEEATTARCSQAGCECSRDSECNDGLECTGGKCTLGNSAASGGKSNTDASVTDSGSASKVDTFLVVARVLSPMRGASVGIRTFSCEGTAFTVETNERGEIIVASEVVEALGDDELYVIVVTGGESRDEDGKWGASNVSCGICAGLPRRAVCDADSGRSHR